MEEDTEKKDENEIIWDDIKVYQYQRIYGLGWTEVIIPARCFNGHGEWGIHEGSTEYDNYLRRGSY